MAGFFPLPFSISQALDPCRRTGLPRFEQARRRWLACNLFPISCALQGLLEVLAAKCNVSPLSPTPAAQLAVIQPAAFPAGPASACSPYWQPSFHHWVSPGLFLPFCRFILPSPSSKKGPCLFAFSHRAIHTILCRRVPACCSGEVDIKFIMPNTSFQVLFFHSPPK